MPSSPNKLSRFWQELKRRNVVRVVTVYAGAAFVIIELINNITEPLRLPVWTPTLVIVLLAIGFPVVIIFSWIYDVHPDGGMVKTEPVDKVKAEQTPKSSNSWKIASYISFVVIVGLIVLNLVPHSGKKMTLDKSIAVLPFVNDSPDEENAYFINGIMEEVLLNLQAIQELRVPGRTSVEQYRLQTKSIPEIAEELDVNYIVEGSGQRYGDRIILRVQLLEGATDKHLWGDSYEKEITSTEVIIEIQSQIAKSIASELQAIITPEEKDLIEKIPTTSLTAYDLYQKGREEHWKYWNNNGEHEALERAEDLYHTALSYDQNFGEAYTGLAWAFWDKHYWETYFNEDFLDSLLIYADLALSCDDQLPEAYTIKGVYHLEIGENEQALSEFDQALKYNPNNWEVYWWKGRSYLDNDLVEAIKNLHKAVSLNRGGEQLPALLRSLGSAYGWAGFIDKAGIYMEEAFKLDNDSVRYYTSLGNYAEYLGNYEEADDFLLKGYALDTNSIDILLTLGYNNMMRGQYELALDYYEIWMEKLNAQGSLAPTNMQRIGYVYWKNGFTEESEYYFDMQVEYSMEMIDLGRRISENLNAYYNLAGVYAFRGDRDKAYENLRIFNQRKNIPLWFLQLFQSDPLFDSIRNEPEFQEIAKDIEAKYQAEHERVRQWLEENDMF